MNNFETEFRNCVEKVGDNLRVLNHARLRTGLAPLLRELVSHADPSTQRDLARIGRKLCYTLLVLPARVELASVVAPSIDLARLKAGEILALIRACHERGVSPPVFTRSQGAPAVLAAEAYAFALETSMRGPIFLAHPSHDSSESIDLGILNAPPPRALAGPRSVDDISQSEWGRPKILRATSPGLKS